jgi:hypothetical protein
MTNPPSVPSEATPRDFFKDSREALRALRKLEPPLTDEVRASFADKVRKSPLARPIAFAVLAQAWTGKTDARWSAIRTSMRQLLLDDREYPSVPQLADSRVRRAWLTSEFSTDHRTDAARAFVARFGYLRPLYILFAEPDNEAWLDVALADYLEELEGALDVARGKPGSKRTSALYKLSPGARVAALISRQLPSKPNAPKGLLAHLRIVNALAQVHALRVEQFEVAQKQLQTLERLLEQQKQEHIRYESALIDARNQTSTEMAKGVALERDLQAAREQLRLQKGVADAKLQDELNRQRAAFRGQLREKLQNVRLYADRPEPAREKIMRLCDEMITLLDKNLSSTQ